MERYEVDHSEAKQFKIFTKLKPNTYYRLSIYKYAESRQDPDMILASPGDTIIEASNNRHEIAKAAVSLEQQLSSSENMGAGIARLKPISWDDQGIPTEFEEMEIAWNSLSYLLG
ncbi:MAG: hypothetical protein IJE78_05470 [Bacteroidaceae bacterium]|nr:hypothetical protein [Bacteroidaceae bacterium]